MPAGLLFDTGALNVDSSSLTQEAQSKKRKRPSAQDSSQDSEIPLVNVEKILARYHKQTSLKTASAPGQSKQAVAPKSGSASSAKTKGKAVQKKSKQSNNPVVTTNSTYDHAASTDGPKIPNKRDRLAAKKTQSAVNGSATIQQPQVVSQTNLQKKMKGKLDGARFRWINEQLYTTTGAAALDMMQDDPQTFLDYHSGFRSQASQWPIQPVDYIISRLQNMAKGLIVDIGCGEAFIAQKLVPLDYKVISYDLSPANSWILQAQCADCIPLPGDEAAVVDVAVCCLSLMGSDWIKQIAEARRILKQDGLLVVAEVSSRFVDPTANAFVQAVCSAGFKLKSQESPNTYFTVFEFVRISEQHTPSIEECKAILKPCLYRKR